MPRSLAIWACDFWLDWTNCTASTLNSLVKVRCSFCMIFSLPVSGSLFQVYLPLFSGSRPKHHGPAKVLEEVSRLLKDHPHVEDLDTKVHYLQKREHLMQYPLFQQQGWPIGSGSVESANTCVVQARLKGPGMHWERRNVNPMLALRTGICNDRWEETMQQASGQRLLTRRSSRFARQKKKYDEMRQKVQLLFLHLFFFIPHPQLKTRHLPASPPQRDLIASSSCATDSRDTCRPALSHPWRRYPRAKK